MRVCNPVKLCQPGAKESAVPRKQAMHGGIRLHGVTSTFTYSRLRQWIGRLTSSAAVQPINMLAINGRI
jgi:hypothetical protein